ncbi:hypothetical protein L3X38_025880 [Prunus dulcis]|uniref:Uncharacterized protein n=1 Tax=Prunus dulcis TaxID=3755 RepID=A0AAD4W548_PRUDU|nr:hypothetical protein L3X38_025880 [Prunus dulcis]
MLCGKLKDEMQPFEMELDIMDKESLGDVIDSLGQGFHYDLIVMNYSFVKEETARDEKWVESLRRGGFIGEMVALVWPGDVPEDEFDSLVVTDRYIGVDDENEGLTLVRSDCMDKPDEFADIFAALLKQASWNRVVLGGPKDKEEGDDGSPLNVADDNNHPFFAPLEGMLFHTNSFMKLNLSRIFAPLEGMSFRVITYHVLYLSLVHYEKDDENMEKNYSWSLGPIRAQYTFWEVCQDVSLHV